MKKGIGILLMVLITLTMTLALGEDVIFRDGDWSFRVEEGNAILAGYEGAETEITIPSAVTRQIDEGNSEQFIVAGLGDKALPSTGMTDITMPDTSVLFGNQCFEEPVEVHAGEWVYIPRYPECTIIGYLGSTAELTVPDTLNGLQVTAFGQGVFKNMAFLHSVKLPDATKTIEPELFYNCRNLHAADLGENLQTLATQTFFACTSLTDVTFPAGSLRTIGDFAFYNCVALTDAGIPDGVTGIGDSAFEGCGNMTSAVLPSSLTTLGGAVFAGCKSLTEIAIPDGVTEIDNNLTAGQPGSFSGCAALSRVSIGKGLTYLPSNTFAGLVNLQQVEINADNIQIAYSAFSGCVALQKAEIKNANIGGYAFNDCSGMKTFTMQSGTLDSGAFSGCSALTTVTLGSGVTSLPDSVFSSLSRLSSVTINGSIISIPSNAFSGCIQLKNIQLPSSVTSIGYSAFYGSGLTDITLPENLTGIESSAFSGCAALKTITWNSRVTSIGDGAFAGCPFTELDIPGTVTFIGSGAFGSCEDLHTVRLPANLSEIGSGAFPAATRIYCNPSSLTARTLSRAGASFVVAGEGAEYGIRLLMRGSISLGLSLDQVWTDAIEITLPSEIDGELVTELGSSLFAACSSVQKVTFPSSVPAIPTELCAGNSSLTEVIIPEGVTIVSAGAFRNCTNLHDVSLPNTVVSIGAEAFDGCALLTEITLSDNIQEIGARAFTQTKVYCALGSKTAEMLSQTGGGFICRNYPLLRLRYLFEDGLPTDLEVVGAVDGAVRVEVPASVTSIAENAFRGNTTLKTVVLPDTLARIGEYAFAESGITALTLPAGVTKIPSHAFENTAALQQITIQGGVTEVGEYAFAGSAIPEVFFPDGLTTVGYYAFQDSQIVSCVMPDTVTSMGDSVFQNCVKLAHFTIPAGVQTIPSQAFYQTTGMKTVEIPSGVEIIGYSAFYGSGLASVSLPASVKRVGGNAFQNCRVLKKVTMAGDMISIGSSAFGNCFLLNDLTMSVTLESMGDYAFQECHALQDVILPRNLVSIPYAAFYNCHELMHAKISDGTVNIGGWAFYSCNQLKSVELPSTLKGIGEAAFQGCKLTSVTIPEGVTTIGNYAFSGNNLTELILPDSLGSLGGNAFGENRNLTSLRLPAGLAIVPDYAFSYSGLNTLTIPGGVRALAYQAFAQSFNLRSVLIPASVESIDDTAFDYCGYPLTIYCNHGTEAEAFATRKEHEIIYLDGEDALEGVSVSAAELEFNIAVNETVEGLKQYFHILPEDAPYEFTLRYTTVEDSVLLVEEIRETADEYAEEEEIGVVVDARMTGLAPGTALLTACLEENPAISASIPVHVRENITDILLPEEIWQKKDEPLPLAPEATIPAGVTDGFTWTIDREIGYIENNVLYPTAYGNGTLTVKAWNGVTKSIPLHVYDDPTEAMIKNVPVGMDVGMSATLMPEVRAGALFTGRLAQHFISWTTSDESIAAVSGMGEVTAAGYGTATVQIQTENGVTGSADIFVSPPITSFQLEGRVLLPVGGSMVLTATEIEPANANPGAFAWTTEPAGLVSYENGIVTVLTDQECDVRITATPWSGAAPKHTDLTIFRPVVESVQIDPLNEWNWVPGYSSVQLTAHVQATGEFINQLVTWKIEGTSSGENYIDEKGILHTGYGGEWGGNYLRVTATADNGVSDSIDIYVHNGTEDFTLPSRIAIHTGETVTVVPQMTYGESRFTVRVGTPALASVNGMEVTGLQPGETELTVTSWDGRIQKTRLMIYDPIETIQITGLDSSENKYPAADPEHNLFVHWNYRAHADAISDKTYTDDLMTWSSSDPAVLRITNERTGEFRAVKYGTATLTARARSGALASIDLNVRKEVRTFTLAPMTGYVQQDLELKAASIDEADAYDGFVWTVSPVSIGTVEGQVLHITATEPVDGTLTAVSWDGYVTKSTDINILREPVTGITLEEIEDGEIGVGGSFQMNAHVTAGCEYLNKRVIWSSSDEQVATVDGNGMVQCLAPGEVTITATADDNEDLFASLTLNAVQGMNGFTVAPAELTLYPGDKAKIEVTEIEPEDAAQRPFSYEMIPAEAGTVENGVLTVQTEYAMEAVLRVTSWNGVIREIPVHIQRPNITGLRTDSPGTCYVNTPLQLTAHVTADGQVFENRFVTWWSENPSIAEVDANGVVTPKVSGSVNIYVADIVGGGYQDSVYLYIIPEAKSYEIYPEESLNLAEAADMGLYIYVSNFQPDGSGCAVTFRAETEEGLPVEVRQDSVNSARILYDGPETTLTVYGVSQNGIERTRTLDVRYPINEFKSETIRDEQGMEIPVTQVIAMGGSKKVILRACLYDGMQEMTSEEMARLKLGYASGDEEVATVDAEGNILGISNGKTTITVTHVYTGLKAEIPVRVVAAVQSFGIPGNIRVPVGGTIDLPVYNLTPADASAADLICTVNPAGIARVENGRITALAQDDVSGTLTISSVNGVSHTANLIIYSPWVDQVELEEIGAVMLGKHVQPIAHVTVGEDEYINLGVKFNVYCDRNADGFFYNSIQENGSGWIDEQTGEFYLTNYWIDPFYLVATSELSGATDMIEIRCMPGYADFQVKTPMVFRTGDADQIVSVISYSPLDSQYDFRPDDRSWYLFYEAEENDLFTLNDRYVSPNGGGRTGTGTVRVRSVNGVTRDVQVVVYKEEEIDGVTVSGVPEYCGIYQTIPLKAVLEMYGTTVETRSELVTWESDAPKVASVNVQGAVRTLGYGTAHITATTPNGKTSTVTITVQREPDNFTLPERFSVEYGESIELYVTSFEPAEALMNVTWRVEPAEAATIEGNILTATAQANMTAVVTAENWDGTVRTAELEITYTPQLSTMYLPSMLSEIDEEAFAGIASEQVYIPAGCGSIGARAFADSTELKRIHIPDSVSYISEDAFDGCGQLTIYCSSDSEAERFAIRNGIPYETE